MWSRDTSPRKLKAIRNSNDPDLVRSTHCRAALQLSSSSRAGIIAVLILPKAQGVLLDQGHPQIFSTRASSQIQIAWDPVHVNFTSYSSVLAEN